MNDLYRGAICKVVILSGDDVLSSGQIAARRLYNFTRYCAVGYNRKLARARGHSSLAGKLPKYLGFIGMYNALHNTDEYKALNDRTAGYILRNFDASIRSWFSNLKRNTEARPPRHLERDIFPPLTFEVGRNAKYLGDGVYRFSVLSGATEKRYVICKVYLPPLTNHDRVESIKYLSDGRCAVSYRLTPKQSTGSNATAIDLGIRRIATVAFDNGESILYDGSALLSSQRYWQKKIARCMPSGWHGKGDGRRLPMSERAKSYYRQWDRQKSLMLHNLSTSIVNECREHGVGTIIIGDLKGIREDKDFGKQTNQQLHAWPFAKLTEMITYKAEEVGIEVVKVSERYTSRACCVCGVINKKSARTHRGLLECADCGAQIHADVNGAFNILRKYLLSHDANGIGVAGGLPTLPSPTARALGFGKFVDSQIDPTFVARFDLRNFSVKMTQIGQQKQSIAIDTSTMAGV